MIAGTWEIKWPPSSERGTRQFLIQGFCFQPELCSQEMAGAFFGQGSLLFLNFGPQPFGLLPLARTFYLSALSAPLSCPTLLQVFLTSWHPQVPLSGLGKPTSSPSTSRAFEYYAHHSTSPYLLY